MSDSRRLLIGAALVIIAIAVVALTQILPGSGSSSALTPSNVQVVRDGKQWSDIGLPQLHGRISIHTTDPTLSNSGNLFAGLLANTFNGGEVVDDASVERVLPQLKLFFTRLGFMEQSSSDLFQQ